MKRLVLAIGAVALFGAAAFVGAHMEWRNVGRTITGEDRPQVGTTYRLESDQRVFLDEGAYRKAVDRKKADVTESSADAVRSYQADERISIPPANDLKVIQVVEGGAKVAVMSGEHKGKIGWVLEDTLIVSGTPTRPR